MSEALDEKDLRVFRELVKSSVKYGYDLNTQYGPEVGFKTILHLALEEEDGFPFAEDLLLVNVAFIFAIKKFLMNNTALFIIFEPLIFNYGIVTFCINMHEPNF